MAPNNTVDVAIEGTTVATEMDESTPYGPDHAIGLFDLSTGVSTRLHSGLAGGRWSPALAWPWVIWVDQRAGIVWEGETSVSECEWVLGCCDNDIYGYNRLTGVEVPFVTGRGMQGGGVTAEGDWAAYEDHNDGYDEMCRDYGCTQIYALHLPTGTEVRVTNWPGRYIQPRVYAGRVLFSQMTAYMDNLYHLWDCNLALP